MRFFNTEGPIRIEDHYYLPPLQRWDLDEVLMNALRATDQQAMLDNMHEAEKLIIDTYCLGYPVVLATSQNLTTQASLIDDGYICSFNEIPVYNNLYLIAE